ncbi:MAG: DUF4159 domain-containing protein [Chloroflexi bacterium]|nr:DUF4159 domain-containing protein [Chloroflexota bacterium]
MAVTAEVWEEAHEYHGQQQRFHALFSHGPGIVAGLEVIASDPPDTSVYILPGIAVDTSGQTIVLPQPVAYDIGHEMEGLLYLLLSYAESRPRAANGASQGDGPLYIHTEFSIFARTTLPATPAVELARINRRSRVDSFVDARNPAYPEDNEIDLRFRREIGAPREISMAVCYLGDVTDKKHSRGASYLARALNHGGRYHVFVDDDVSLAPGVENYTLIYLVGAGSFELSRSQMNGLSNYVRKGRGTLFIESSDTDAQATFLNFLESVDLEVEPIPAGHRLLIEPYLFGAPPPGFETKGKSDVLVGDGVIISTREYGRLWQGERRDGVASREEIRSAIEWGGNILAYARERHRW